MQARYVITIDNTKLKTTECHTIFHPRSNAFGSENEQKDDTQPARLLSQNVDTFLWCWTLQLKKYDKFLETSQYITKHLGWINYYDRLDQVIYQVCFRNNDVALGVLEI